MRGNKEEDDWDEILGGERKERERRWERIVKEEEEKMIGWKGKESIV